MKRARFRNVSFTKIMVAVDGSENASRAAETAIAIAKKQGAELLIVNVIPIPLVSATGYPSVDLGAYFKAMEDDGGVLLARLAKLAGEKGVKATTAVLENNSSAVLAITKHAEENGVDLIVVGTRGAGGFKKALLGSVSNGVLNHAHCSVLVTR